MDRPLNGAQPDLLDVIFRLCCRFAGDCDVTDNKIRKRRCTICFGGRWIGSGLVTAHRGRRWHPYFGFTILIGTLQVVYSDGSQTIVVNGHFLQSDGQQTIVLHEGDDITQYYINNENGTYSQVADQANKCFSEVLITDNTELEGIASMEDGNIVQYVEDEDNSQGDVIYITDDQQLITMPEFKVKNLEQDNVNCDPQIVDIDDLIQQQQSEGETGVMSNRWIFI